MSIFWGVILSLTITLPLTFGWLCFTLIPPDQYLAWFFGLPIGRVAIVVAGLAIGVLLMGLQLWLLTIALDLYLSDRNEGVWQLALTSGLIFLGGIFVWRIALPRRK